MQYRGELPFFRGKPIRKEDREQYSLLKKFCAEHECAEYGDIYYQFGYETFGIILYGFCKWMMDDLKKTILIRYYSLQEMDLS